MTEAVLLLGSNQGDRLLLITDALKEIASSAGRILQKSSFYESEPWGKSDQPLFVNMAVIAETTLNPDKLLNALLTIETKMGRIRNDEKWGSRSIDIDIIFFGSHIIKEPHLIVPHPFLQARRFTLVPLNEVIPHFIHPVLQKSVSELLKECPDLLKVNVISY